MSQVQSNQILKDKHQSLWTEITDKDSSQISGGKCRWVRTIGLVCDTPGGTIAL